ncbi:uncharacterized protein LOC143285805 [Babylonia areolata]|uniref:uncharacterized protein LOC143285805 n=1 Tax=Babylonia areolata TaxID=304850 RepID=UPI003FD53F05
MAVGKLGVALVVALASNVSLFSMLMYPREPSVTPTTATPTTTSGISNLGGELYETTLPDNLKSTLNRDQLGGKDEILQRRYGFRSKVEDRSTGGKRNVDDPSPVNKELESAEARSGQSLRPASDRRQPEGHERHEKQTFGDGSEPRIKKRNMKTRSENERLNNDTSSERDTDRHSSHNKAKAADPRPQQFFFRPERGHADPRTGPGDLGVTGESQVDVDPQPSRRDRSPKSQREDLDPVSQKGGLHHPGSDSEKERENRNVRAGSNRNFKPRYLRLPKAQDPRSELINFAPSRGDVKPSLGRGRYVPGRGLRRGPGSDHQLSEIIASLTDSELRQLDSATSKILVPALRRLETVVLRELERLHEVNRHQESRLQRLEQGQLQWSEVQEAIQVIREEQRRLQQGPTTLMVTEEPASHTTSLLSAAPSGTQHSNDSSASNKLLVDVEKDDRLEQLDDDGSGSGEATMKIWKTTVAMTTTTTTTTTTTSAPSRRNTTMSSDQMIINHIYELYNSLSSMEHKVLELDTRLTTVSSDVFRQRGSFQQVEDKVAENSRHHRSLQMRSTMNGFKLSDLEQFKGKAEVVLGSAEGRVEQLDSLLEVLTDRLMTQGDEVEIMRDVHSRLQQVASELRSADSFKAHDVQELRRLYQQVETRLNNLYHTLEESVGNIRWDVKTYLDHLCTYNNLDC